MLAFSCCDSFACSCSHDRLGDLALDRKDIGDVAVIALRPELRVGARIDQLGGDAHAVGQPMHRPLEHMRDAELLSDLAPVARRVARILLHAQAADHLQVGDLREVRQDLALDAVREERVLLVAAEILEWQHRDALGGMFSADAGAAMGGAVRAAVRFQGCQNQ